MFYEERDLPMYTKERDGREDNLPEHIRYRDEGCDWFSSCINCPLPRCRFDEPGWYQQELRERRNQQLLQVRRVDGKSAAELAKMFRISKRTVHRIIRNAHGEDNYA
ncbi:MAG: helix-turn-helix domain-containing protein [Dehalococcoidia bacterium]